MALAENRLEIVDIARDSGYVLAIGPVNSFWSYGEHVGVFVGRDSSNTQALAVEVVSKRVLATNFAAKNWTKLAKSKRTADRRNGLTPWNLS